MLFTFPSLAQLLTSAFRAFRVVGLVAVGLAILVGLLASGCGPAVKLQTPLPIKSFDTKVDEVIGLHVPEATRQYVEKGQINVVPYSVDFGNAIEANARHALAQAFREVVLLETFPTSQARDGRPGRAVSVEISGSKVSPGAMTFLATSAVLRLQAKVAVGDEIDAAPVEIEGRGEASPGALGAIPILFANQVAYDRALQQACELALKDALEKLVDVVVARARGGPR